MRVRVAAAGDEQAIAAIACQAATVSRVRWEPGRAAKEIAAAQSLVLVAQTDVVIGFLAARRVAEDEWELDMIAVDASLRRGGVGSSLLREFFARVSRPCKIYLEVAESNLVAQEFYKKSGAKPVFIRKDYYRIDESGSQEAACVLLFQLS